MIFTKPNLLLTACLFIVLTSNAQQLQSTAKDAYLITRMAEKFHIRPKPVDETFGDNVFTQLISKVDADKLFITAEDIALLKPFKDKLHVDINTSNWKFLEQFIAICQSRFKQADTMINSLSNLHYDVNKNETYSQQEDTSYPANTTAMRLKLQKNIKLKLVQVLAYEYKAIQALPIARQKKVMDSIELFILKRINKNLKRTIYQNLNAPGGITASICNKYCDAIAGCYDPHSEFMSISERENFESHLGKKAFGFGFSLDEDDDGNTVVDNLKPGSPAFKSGKMNSGDKIISIQWDNETPIDVSESSTSEIEAILNSSNHAKATITLQKADGEKRQVPLYKEQATEDDDDNKVKSYILSGSHPIGYISLPSFYEDWENSKNINGCANDVAKEIIKLKKENIEGLILDLRFNGGGSLMEAVELSGIFIDAGPITILRTREPKPVTYKDMNRGTIYDGPLVVMINGFSASASELFAGTLQDYNRALIVGSTTYGKATGQSILPLDTTIEMNSKLPNVANENYLKMTLTQLYRVTGETAQFKGVVPNVFIPDLTEVSHNKERNEPFAIPSNTIEANKYYQPLKPISTKGLQEAANAEINKVIYFSKLEKYKTLKADLKKKKDISLRLDDYIKNYMPIDEDSVLTSDSTKADFKILNNAYDIKRQEKNSTIKETNEEQLNYLEEDPYLKVVYRIIQQMILH